MKSSKKLVLEIKKLNNKLEHITQNNRYFVYNSNPLKFAWFNFIGGVFHSIGTLVGTVLIASLLVFLLSKTNFLPISNWLQGIVNQLRIDQIVPKN